ncbi:hypothetical protein PVX_110935 [Plasmodium vivax]|uniref:Uncharacterized protein n=1 Tax=Plasmodium vivax (strain Salvador I) TaxID=126793 RepID=A5KDU2_PLAVS|nr:hypothetical protein PVX_110935 [Plasmodium vivax]EDL42388.1 hypothetical protein PVX_110935 [Plasmodium vivax]|eukprot:XP_001608412.1 hypothetical protein [Plasmodium vivax Sal-1]
MKKFLGVVLYFFLLNKYSDAKNGNLRTSDVKNEQVEKRKKSASGWVPYYLPPKGQTTTPIALLAALPEKTTFRGSANVRKDVKEEGEQNVSGLPQSGETNDTDFQFELQIVDGADHSTEAQLEGGSSPADAVHGVEPAGEVGEAPLEEAVEHAAEHAAELVAELVEEPQAAPDAPPAAEEAQPQPVQEADEVSVEEKQEGTPSVAEQAVDESVPSQPADESVPSQPEDADVPSLPADADAPSLPADADAPSLPADADAPSQPEDADAPSQPEDADAPSQSADASAPEPDESNGSEVDTVEEAGGKENFYHLEEDEEEEEEEEMDDDEFEDDYDIVMHKINEHEGEKTPSGDNPKYLTRADIITMLAVRNMLSSFNYDYAVMDFLTGFNPGVIGSFYVF